MTVLLGRLRRGCVRGAQVVSLREGVRLWRVEGGFRAATPVDRSLCSLELGERAAPLERENREAREGIASSVVGEEEYERDSEILG